MKTDDLARDDRFRRTPFTIDFMIAEEVNVEQVEETMKYIMAT